MKGKVKDQIIKGTFKGKMTRKDGILTAMFIMEVFGAFLCRVGGQSCWELKWQKRSMMWVLASGQDWSLLPWIGR